ncbi:MAG TPA: SH3 domain-containing protein [Verrucomicrobiae bacterium]|nr:SH3 domain-containing protein [Verrucomicrobiae bacterium]
MKTNCWLILGTMLATTAVAQVNTNRLPEIPPPAIPSAPAPMLTPAQVQTNAPAKKIVHTKKKAAKKKVVKAAAKMAPALPAVPLVAGPATVVAEHVNLRGQAGLKGEVVGHAQKGDTLSVISEITLDKPKAGEPAHWAKIALPTSTKVWVDAKYVDTTNNVVLAKKLNLRGGPGENYSVLGVIEKGAAISVVTTKGDWTQIEPPASAFAFVASSYLRQGGSMIDTNVPVQPVVASTENVPAPQPPPAIAPPATIPQTPATVADAQPIAPPATTPPPTPETVPPVPPATSTESVPPPTLPTTVTPATIMPQPTLATDDDTNLPPPPPRIVTHEGSVRHSVSLVAPTVYELYDPANNKAINYLYTTTTNLNLGRYDGLHITVTGEEGLDVRWKDTPVLTIQKIYVLSADKPLKPVAKHWWSK